MSRLNLVHGNLSKVSLHMQTTVKRCEISQLPPHTPMLQNFSVRKPSGGKVFHVTDRYYQYDMYSCQRLVPPVPRHSDIPLPIDSRIEEEEEDVDVVDGVAYNFPIVSYYVL